MFAFASLILLLASAIASDPDAQSVQLVTYGSTIKLEHVATQHRLHSHNLPYGTGSGQQSVTAFPDSGDSNSYWIVKSAHAAPVQLAGTVVRCGDKIRLQHLNTAKNLHSHTHRAPMTNDYEVSAYGLQLLGRWMNGDQGDDWVLECPTRSAADWKRFDNVRFQHVQTSSFLSSDVSYKFGDPIPNQLQVCASTRKNRNTLWKTNEGFYLAPLRLKQDE